MEKTKKKSKKKIDLKLIFFSIDYYIKKLDNEVSDFNIKQKT